MALVESQIMKKGSPIIGFREINYDGRKIDLEEFYTKKLICLVFTCNHCPYAEASWPVLVDLQTRYRDDAFQIIAINSNHSAREKYPEDSFDKMSSYANKNKINFPYLVDENQELSRAYNAVCTPDPFLFIFDKSASSSFSLFYHGRLNDNWKEPENVKENSMELFILAALERGEAPELSYPSMGCSIKWITKDNHSK